MDMRARVTHWLFGFVNITYVIVNRVISLKILQSFNKIIQNGVRNEQYIVGGLFVNLCHIIDIFYSILTLLLLYENKSIN